MSRNSLLASLVIIAAACGGDPSPGGSLPTDEPFTGETGTILFVAQVPHGDLQIDVDVLRQGRSMSHVSASLRAAASDGGFAGGQPPWLKNAFLGLCGVTALVWLIWIIKMIVPSSPPKGVVEGAINGVPGKDILIQEVKEALDQPGADRLLPALVINALTLYKYPPAIRMKLARNTVAVGSLVSAAPFGGV